MLLYSFTNVVLCKCVVVLCKYGVGYTPETVHTLHVWVHKICTLV